jgi:hypothetical protein
LVVSVGLAEAVRRESASAVCHWWRVTPQTVSKWRKEMGVGQMTEGTARLKSVTAAESPGCARARELAHAKLQDPERRRKIGEALRGKPRPDHVVEAMRKGRLGKPQSAEARRKMSEAKKGKPRPPRRDWTRDEDALLGEVPDDEVARRTGRRATSVKSRRQKLKVGRYGDQEFLARSTRSMRRSGTSQISATHT